MLWVMRSMLLSALLLIAVPLFGSGLSQDDEAAVRTVMERYVAAWLEGDPAAIMRQLTDDSVLIPGDKAPHVGAEAIRRYWWPPNAPKFAITRFENTVDGLSESSDLAVVRGMQVIEWTSGAERWR